MKEYNKKTIIEALSTLPEHEPPDQIWNALQQQITDEEFFTPKLLQALPEYEPPASVWGKVIKNLDKPRSIFLSTSWKQALAVAASVLFVAISFWLLQPQSQNEEQFTISYSTETADPMLLNHDWDEDEEAFTRFQEICESKKYVCERPEFKQLQTELDDLTDAKMELKNAMGDFGANPELITQIKEIELERTDLLKKMMVMLI